MASGSTKAGKRGGGGGKGKTKASQRFTYDRSKARGGTKYDTTTPW